MSVIQLENITKIYTIGEVETRALDDVSLNIEDGEFTALVGPSGSGKTTILQLMGCLDKPNRGVVKINGQDATRLKANQRADLRREMIGFIFQFFALVPVLTAYENVELPLLLNGVPATERKNRALEMLEAVGLTDRINHRPDQLSGGEQQRVAIARALGPRPAMVLADQRPIWTRPMAHRLWKLCSVSTNRQTQPLSLLPTIRALWPLPGGSSKCRMAGWWITVRGTTITKSTTLKKSLTNKR